MSLVMLLKPRISEKSYGLSKTHNTYVFDVPKTANKITIGEAVEAQFKVTVTKVNVTVAKGKAKRTVHKGGASVAGRRVDVKKAYVTLKAGDDIPVFAAVDEADKQQVDTKTPGGKK